MTYKLMYMETVVVLYNKLNSEGKIPEGLKVKLSLDDNTYIFKGGLTSNKPYDRFPLYNEDGSLYYNPRCEAIYVCEDHLL